MPWRLPAEWEPQEAVWLVWPRDPLTWPDRVERVRAVFLEAMRAVAQEVRLAVHPALAIDVQERLEAGGLAHVVPHPVEHQDSWIRDHGALTLVDDDGGRRCLDFRFDAWGGKYESLMADDAVTARLAAAWPAPLERVPDVLEGGAVETDGAGTFLATRSVAAARGQSVEEHEALLRDHLGARQVVWLEEGIEGDDTDGHIDTIARFIAPGKVVVAQAPRGHPDHAALASAAAVLGSATDARGRAIEAIPLPVPPRQETDAGDVLPAGHANFLITNEAVLVPTYGGPSDAQALAVLEDAFPRRRVVGLDHRDMVWGFGGIHCLSMQVPRAMAAPPAS